MGVCYIHRCAAICYYWCCLRILISFETVALNGVAVAVAVAVETYLKFVPGPNSGIEVMSSGIFGMLLSGGLGFSTWFRSSANELKSPMLMLSDEIMAAILSSGALGSLCFAQELR